jgi:putative oxidoreductase
MIPLEYYAVAGRVFLASLFIAGGLLFFRKPDFAFALSVIKSHNLPFARLLLVGTMTMQLVCGTMLLVGWHASVAAAIFLVWLIPATIMFHPFWKLQQPQAANEMFHFLKNISVAGALLLVIGLSGWQ